MPPRCGTTRSCRAESWPRFCCTPWRCRSPTSSTHGWIRVFARPCDAIAVRAHAASRSIGIAAAARADPAGCLGLRLVAGIVAWGVFGQWLAPYDPFKIDVAERLLGPSLDHLLGTDKLGRDVFSRVLTGSRLALIVGVLPIAVSLVLGTGLGLIAG